MYRVCRLGQTFDQFVRRYYVPGTYHADMKKTMFNRTLQIEMSPMTISTPGTSTMGESSPGRQ